MYNIIYLQYTYYAVYVHCIYSDRYTISGTGIINILLQVINMAFK